VFLYHGISVRHQIRQISALPALFQGPFSQFNNMLQRIFLILALFAFSAHATTETSALLSRMEAKYRSAKTLQATFLERYSENGRVLRSESGIAYFRRPGKMRWEYEAPEKDLFLVDGKTAWFYVPGDHTVTRLPAKQNSDFRTPIALLAGEMKVSRVCSRVEVATSEKAQTEGATLLSCAPRGAQDPKATTPAQDTILFEVLPDSGELARIAVRQADGVELQFRFAKWQFDPPLPSSMFRFEVPPGVAIVKGDPTSGGFAAH
jgi:outer membrane lipoprotein carrier protein